MQLYPLSVIVEEYIRQRAESRLAKFDKAAKKQRESGVDEDEIASSRQKEADKFIPHVWLSHAAKRAPQIKLVTHALKYTHTDAKGSSIYVQAGQAYTKPYLCTVALQNSSIDVVGNAAALDVAGLLKLETDNISLLACIEKDDVSPLAPFAQSDDQLDNWLQGFKEVFKDSNLASHKFAKQTYFPVANNEYHLLGSLFSSALAHRVYQHITKVRYHSEPIKEARACKRAGIYSPQQVVDFTKLAVQGFGGTKPQNVSQLNSAQRGRVFLLPSQPPTWQTKLVIPLAKKSFWQSYDRRAWKTARNLGLFLNKVKHQNNIEIRNTRHRYVEELIELLLICGSEVRNAKDRAGWSQDSNISEAEKYWLDPYRVDEEFQQEMEKSDWQKDIAGQFSTWLNGQLKRHKLNVADVEHREWLKETKQTLLIDLEGFDQ